MFDRFIRLAKAKKALSEERYEQALQLADDPIVRDDRRASDIRTAAKNALLQRADLWLAKGDPQAAIRDLERAQLAMPDAAIDVRLVAAKQQLATIKEQLVLGRKALAQAKNSAERGALAVAVAGIAAVPMVAALLAERIALEAFVGVRRASAKVLLSKAEQCLLAKDVASATAQYRLAAAQDDAVGFTPFAEQLALAFAEWLLSSVKTAIASGDLAAANGLWRAPVNRLVMPLVAPAVLAAGEQIAKALCEKLQQSQDPVAESVLITMGACEPPLPGDGARLATACRALQQVPILRAKGMGRNLVVQLQVAATQLAAPALAREVLQLQNNLAAADQGLLAARAVMAAGDLVQARVQLALILRLCPMHDAARSELDSLDDGLRERAAGVQKIRDAAKAGRLREAYALALAKAAEGPVGEPERLLMQDLAVRMELVQKELSEVLAALSSSAMVTADGVRQGIARIEQLSSVQSDREDLPRVLQALAAELLALAKLDQSTAQLTDRCFGGAAVVLAELVFARASFVTPTRLDDRILALLEALALHVEDAIAAGFLSDLAPIFIGLNAAVPFGNGWQARIEHLNRLASDRMRAACLQTDAARQRIAARDLAGAESLCEQALQLWLDSKEARSIEQELRQLRGKTKSIERITAMTAGGDVDAAQDAMYALSPTPQLLRTQIYDIKQSLAKAQGLSGAFLLRVDEGGEFLVLRGESVVIGNLRDGRVDLPIMAAITGRHARIQRSMSFHGGMEDLIVPETGEVRVGGVVVTSHKLRTGDRVQLGTTLQFVYAMPSSRSLSASLRLLGGFQAGFTDQVLLLKDRGRDGRILIGAGHNVHVQVANAKADVEVFAHKTGQIRVRCESGGTIDGRPFSDEHPVDPGALVQVAGVSFVLLPFVPVR